ncbi:hypothetical protein CBS147332_357 [Penicillium roqueforti]|nr:hypothetical protein CBS147332_357 [Penicillium roqueforti]KAI3101909.1 hypothetical protein CBS147331_7708 [Penicillium roqueforti]
MLQRSLMCKNNQNPAGDKSRRSHSWQSLTDDSLLIETIINIGPPPKRNPDPFQCMESQLWKQTSQPKKNQVCSKLGWGSCPSTWLAWNLRQQLCRIESLYPQCVQPCIRYAGNPGLE